MSARRAAGVDREQVGQGVDDGAEREIAVAGTEHAGQTGVGLDRAAEAALLAEHDVLGVGGAGLAGGLLHHVGGQRPGAGQERRRRAAARR